MDTSSTVKVIAASGLLLATACARGPSVRPQLSQTTGAVRAAEEMGTEQVPAAALHFKYATEELKRGRALLDEGEDEKARRSLERAEMDAELAMALVREDRAQNELEQVNDELNEMNTNLSE